MLKQRTVPVPAIRRLLLVLTWALLALFSGGASGMDRQERIIAGGPADSLEVRHLVLTGTNEEIGRALAEIARDRYHLQLAASSDPIRTRAARLYIEKYYPILYQRMRGVAAAYGHSIDDDRWDYSSLGFTELHAACSIVHLPPAFTASGKSVVSRDYDYSTGSLYFGPLQPGMLHPTSRPYLLELHPDKGYASLAMVAYDLLSGVLDGINSEGLTVTMAMDEELMPKMEPAGISAGLGELQTLRLILDTAATADEAKQILLDTKQYYAFIPVHYLIADRFGNAFVWEYSQAHNREFIIENPGQVLAMTNFTLNRRLDNNRPPSSEQAQTVCKRYSLLTRELGAQTGISEDKLKETHHKVDAELPASATPGRPPVRTMWHALYYPEERRVSFSYYLHDEQLTDGKLRVVRSRYIDFRLAPTNQGTGSPPPSPPTKQSAAAPSARPGVSEALAQLKAGGATTKEEDGKTIELDLSKAEDLKRMVPLLGDLPDVTWLIIQNPLLDDSTLALLPELPKLKQLNLFSAAITDEALKLLGKRQGLVRLAIGKTKISDAGLAHLTALNNLEYLGLLGDSITDAGLESLAQMKKLKTLNLSETMITNAGLGQLANLGQLEVLFLSGDDIGDDGLAQLERVPTITGLFLQGTQVSDAGLVHLRTMSRLTKLNLAKTKVTENGVAAAKQFLPMWITIQRE
ncbi:MAG TPA: C45 family autoproteolytic acyltransferase/hydrolase [Candidatus Angelobacter sp.]|nr:C45 family autoproteolytic acyltransferase/hydrolase [Candidatus Angelobacter sp.]